MKANEYARIQFLDITGFASIRDGHGAIGKMVSARRTYGPPDD